MRLPRRRLKVVLNLDEDRIFKMLQGGLVGMLGEEPPGKLLRKPLLNVVRIAHRHVHCDLLESLVLLIGMGTNRVGHPDFETKGCKTRNAWLLIESSLDEKVLTVEVTVQG